MKTLRIILCIVSLSGLLLLSAFDSEQQKVYDYAGLYTAEEIQELGNIAIQYANDVELDLIILTTMDKEGMTSKQYAENFYDENGFGYEYSYGSCVILLIDMEDRYAYIATQGIAIQYIDDQDIESILDDVFEYLPNEDYFNSALSFLETTKFYANEYISDSANSDNIERWKEGGYSDYSEYYNDHYEQGGEYYTTTENDNLFSKLKTPYISLGIALLIGGIFVLIVGFKSKTKMKANGSTYMDRNNFNVNEKQDLFIGTTTVRRTISKNTGGKGGGSGGSFSIGSGGHSHGGGGRSF